MVKQWRPIRMFKPRESGMYFVTACDEGSAAGEAITTTDLYHIPSPAGLPS